MKQLFLFFVFAFFWSYSIIGQNYENNNFEIKTISIFKNGTAFFQKEIIQKTNSNKAIITKLPIANNEAIFGTIWFNAPGNQILKIGSFIDSVKNTFHVKDKLSMLKANKFHTLNLIIEDFKNPVIGEIIQVEKDFILIKTKDSWISTSPSKIKHVVYNQKPVTTFSEKSINGQIEIILKKAEKKQKIELTYMQKGLIWTPNYYIRITDENKAKITLRANVMNDIGDITNTDINFVVGVPSFSFSHVESPITSDDDVEDFLAILNGKKRTGRYAQNNNINLSNSITTQQSMGNYAPQTSVYDNKLTGEGSSDEGLYFYKKENISLKKGERAFLELLETEIEFEQIYSVDLKENTNIYSRYYSNNNTSENKVWHSIRFTNNTKSPFTTGTAFIMRKQGDIYKPVSQNYLYYTPTGIKTTVKTTISPDISVTDNEKEISRKERALQYHDLITVEAEIIIENFKNKDIQLEIKRLITGELIKSNTKYEKISKLKSWNSKNKQNDTRWDINLKANEKKTIRYTYKIYVSR